MKPNNFLKQMRGDSMLFFNKKPKYLVFDNKTNRELVRINEIAYVKTIDWNNDFFINISLINGSLLEFVSSSEEIRDKTYEKIKNILIDQL